MKKKCATHAGVQHNISKNSFTLAGFTLAEVLITLGIIGVVAALTMPSLIASYQKKALETQFKKVYSMYSQNLQKTAIVDFGESLYCYYLSTGGAPSETSDCPKFFDKFAENLKVVKTCKGNGFADGCLPDYDWTVGSSCVGFSPDSIKTKSSVYVLADGSIMMNYISNGTYPLVAFDTNGLKGPNKVGYDVFGVQIMGGDVPYKFSASISACLNSAAGAPFKTLDDIYSDLH